MIKFEFLKKLEEIIYDDILIGDSVDYLNSETRQNKWSFSISQELANEFDNQDLIIFFEKVLKNRKQQIKTNNKKGMIFYLWFDKQSASLAFNLICEEHIKLPFGCEIKLIDDYEEIISDFLNYPYHDGFPIEEVDNDQNEIDDSDEEITVVEPLKVFTLKLKNT